MICLSQHSRKRLVTAASRLLENLIYSCVYDRANIIHKLRDKNQYRVHRVPLEVQLSKCSGESQCILDILMNTYEG